MSQQNGTSSNEGKPIAFYLKEIVDFLPELSEEQKTDLKKMMSGILKNVVDLEKGHQIEMDQNRERLAQISAKAEKLEKQIHSPNEQLSNDLMRLQIQKETTRVPPSQIPLSQTEIDDGHCLESRPICEAPFHVLSYLNGIKNHFHYCSPDASHEEMRTLDQLTENAMTVFQLSMKAKYEEFQTSLQANNMELKSMEKKVCLMEERLKELVGKSYYLEGRNKFLNETIIDLEKMNAELKKELKSKGELKSTGESGSEPKNE